MRNERLLQADRYLPCRKANSQDHSWTHSSTASSTTASSTTASSRYLHLITASPKRCLAFSKTSLKAPQDCSLTFAKSHPLLGQNRLELRGHDAKLIQKLMPEKIVEVPDIQNNFYFSAFDGSSKGLLAIGIKNQTYLYDSKTEQTFGISLEMLNPLDSVLVTCLKFNKPQSLLYVAKDNGSLDLCDINKMAIVRTIHNHFSRVGCIQNTEEWGFLSGSKDKTIVHNDVRIAKSATLKVLAHKQEVCGLSLRHQTVASGSNDGRVSIWDLRNKQAYLERKFHQSAAKALQWCPWKVQLLACGSGAKDHQIIFWNNQEQAIEKTLNAKSQVTGLRWRSSRRDLVTVHGGRRGYGLVWDYQQSRYKAVLSGHTGRILGLWLQGDSDIWTVSSDETMRLWRTGKTGEVLEANRPDLMQLMLK